MQQAPTSFLHLINKALRGNFDNVASEPLPQRWVDLINYLNENERIQRHAPQSETARDGKRPRPN